MSDFVDDLTDIEMAKSIIRELQHKIVVLSNKLTWSREEEAIQADYEDKLRRIIPAYVNTVQRFMDDKPQHSMHIDEFGNLIVKGRKPYWAWDDKKEGEQLLKLTKDGILEICSDIPAYPHDIFTASLSPLVREMRFYSSHGKNRILIPKHENKGEDGWGNGATRQFMFNDRLEDNVADWAIFVVDDMSKPIEIDLKTLSPISNCHLWTKSKALRPRTRTVW